MDYVIAIPSYKRAELLMQETMQTLKDIDLCRIHVFLSEDDSQLMTYSRLLDHRVNEVITTAKNATEKFNAIHDYFEPGTKVFVMEDDVQLVYGSGKVNDGRPVADVDAMIRTGFDAIGDAGIWGIVPHSNAFYFSGGVSQSLKLIVAHAFGFVATRDPWLAVSQPSKTDYERTARYWTRYGRVTRLDNYGAKTKSYTQKGGMQADYTKEIRAALEEQSVVNLTARFPHLLARKEKKTSPFAEMRFLSCKLSQPELVEYQRVLDRVLKEPVSP